MISNRDKYLLIQKSILDGKIEKTEFLEKFMPSIGDYIARGYKLSNKALPSRKNSGEKTILRFGKSV